MGYFPDDTSALFIDGELRPTDGGTYPVVNPATGEQIGHAANGTLSPPPAAPTTPPTGPATRPSAPTACANSTHV